MKKEKLLVAMLAAAVSPAVACDCCSVYGASPHANTGLFAGAAEQFTHFGTLQLDGMKVDNEAGQWLDSSISQLFVGYNISKRFSVQFTLPLIHREYKRPEDFDIDRGHVSGPGDATLTARFIGLQKRNAEWSYAWTLLGGVKFPTGDSGRLAEELNEMEVPGAPESGIHGHDLALGSGSVDGIIGTSVSIEWKRVFLNGNLQYAIRTKGDYDYRYANDLIWSGGPGVVLYRNDTAEISLQLNVSGEHKNKDRFKGAAAEDTALTAVYLGPEINFAWSDRLSAELGVDMPVSIDNSALQTVPDYRLHAAVTWRF